MLAKTLKTASYSAFFFLCFFFFRADFPGVIPKAFSRADEMSGNCCCLPRLCSFFLTCPFVRSPDMDASFHFFFFTGWLALPASSSSEPQGASSPSLCFLFFDFISFTQSPPGGFLLRPSLPGSSLSSSSSDLETKTLELTNVKQPCLSRRKQTGDRQTVQSNRFQMKQKPLCEKRNRRKVTLTNLLRTCRFKVTTHLNKLWRIRFFLWTSLPRFRNLRLSRCSSSSVLGKTSWSQQVSFTLATKPVKTRGESLQITRTLVHHFCLCDISQIDQRLVVTNTNATFQQQNMAQSDWYALLQVLVKSCKHWTKCWFL